MEELTNTYLLDINAMTEGLVIRLAPSRLLTAFSLETGMRRSTSQSIEKQMLVSKSKRKCFKQIIIIPAR